MSRLTDNVSIVTGAGRGIGRGIALELARTGANVVIADINESSALKVADEVQALGRRALAMKVDVTKSSEVNGMVEKTLEEFGKIDILVNNVGINIGGNILENSEGDWDTTFDVNVKSMFLCSKAVAPHMIKQKSGKIINIASAAGKRASASQGIYHSSKAAVIMFTQCLALEMAPYNINVNAICPGQVWTGMAAEYYIKEAAKKGKKLSEDDLKKCREEHEAQASQYIPLRRIQTPEDIGKMAVFLASPEARNITGEAINVSGGMF